MAQTELNPARTLTEAEISFLLFRMNREGGFRMALWNAIAKADLANQRKLAGVFPEEVEVYRRFATEEGYFDLLQSLAKKENVA